MESLPPRKVLIVDDEEVLASNLQTYFRRCGWDARVACNGTVAVRTAGEFLPEVILLDFQLPDMNGLKVLEIIRATHDCRGCVLMTAHPPEDVAEDAKRHGISCILNKPFPLAGLESEVLAAAESAGAPPGTTGDT